jgi:hypothetical protein
VQLLHGLTPESGVLSPVQPVAAAQQVVACHGGHHGVDLLCHEPVVLSR